MRKLDSSPSDPFFYETRTLKERNTLTCCVFLLYNYYIGMSMSHKSIQIKTIEITVFVYLSISVCISNTSVLVLSFLR